MCSCSSLWLDSQVVVCSFVLCCSFRIELIHRLFSSFIEKSFEQNLYFNHLWLCQMFFHCMLVCISLQCITKFLDFCTSFKWGGVCHCRINVLKFSLLRLASFYILEEPHDMFSVCIVLRIAYLYFLLIFFSVSRIS